MPQWLTITLSLTSIAVGIYLLCTPPETMTAFAVATGPVEPGSENPPGGDDNPPSPGLQVQHATLPLLQRVMYNVRYSSFNAYGTVSRAHALSKLIAVSEQADNKYFGIELTEERADQIEAEISASEDKEAKLLLCPLSYSLIKTPVQITSGNPGVVCDYHEAYKWVQQNQTNPFTREKMTLEQLAEKALKADGIEYKGFQFTLNRVITEGVWAPSVVPAEPAAAAAPTPAAVITHTPAPLLTTQTQTQQVNIDSDFVVIER